VAIACPIIPKPRKATRIWNLSRALEAILD
jgi:hypothetical protein